MREIVDFIQGVFSINAKDPSPIGLMGFRETNIPIVQGQKKKNKNQDVNITELLRRH